MSGMNVDIDTVQTRRVKQCNSQRIWTETTSLTSRLRQILPSFFSLDVTSSVQSQVALRLETGGGREAESLQALHFPPICLPYPQWGHQSWAEHSRDEGQEESQQQENSRASPLSSQPFQLRGQAKEKEFCKSEQWHDSSWKRGTETEGNRGHLWSWLWFCSPEWTDPPAARPCPVLHFPAAEMHRSTEMKPQQSRWAREAGILCIFRFQCTQNKSV